jgi:hypothetical protein
MSSSADSKLPPGWGDPQRKMTDEEWQEKLAWVREGAAQWRKDHPEEVEAARLKDENARLQYELNQAKARVAENVDDIERWKSERPKPPYGDPTDDIFRDPEEDTG